MICQETNILLAVTEFDFDLSNGEFCKYLRSRTGWSLKGCEDPDLLEFMITDPGAEQWILESPKYCYLNGNKIPFGKERKQKVKIIQIQKGKIQDCWELFQQHGHLPS